MIRPHVVLVALLLAGIGADPARALVGGRELTAGDIPPAFVLVSRDGVWGCGGSLIAERLVLTAAHCVVGSASGKPLKAGRFSVVRPGAVVDKALSKRSVAVTKVIVSFSTSPARYGNDLALLRLESPVRGAAPAPLARTTPAVGARLSMTAFGPTSLRASITRTRVDDAGRARGATFAVRLESACTKIRAYREVFEPETMLCVGTPAHGDDTCPGDSGAPAFAGGETVAVVSFSLNSSCQGRRPPGPVVLARPDAEFLDLVAREAGPVVPTSPEPPAVTPVTPGCATSSSSTMSSTSTTTTTTPTSTSTSTSSSSSANTTTTTSVCPGTADVEPASGTPDDPEPVVQTRAAVQIIVPEAKLAEDGWVLEPGGTRFHVSQGCRETIEAKGMPIGIVSASVIDSVPESRPPACDAIAIPAPTPDAFIALAPERIAPDLDGYLIDASGRKAYLSATCRRQLLAEGLLIRLTHWVDLERRGDSPARTSCS